MKMGKRIGSLAICLGLLLAFAGCGRNHIMDGPGMENDMPWVAFDLSRSDSESQCNFWITVEHTEEGYILTGECRDEDGSLYCVENGIQLPVKERAYLVGLKLQDLPDAVSAEEDSDLLILDAPQISLVLTYLDGTQQEKVIASELSLQIYKHFLPRFQKYGPVEW